MKKYYFDTSIWLDFFEKRGKHGEVALKLILKIIAKNHLIIYSNLIEKELKQLGYFCKVLPRRDVLHAILAKDNEAQLVSRDHHFEKLKDIITAKIPEDLI